MVGVDFPTVALSSAWWDRPSSTLTVSIQPACTDGAGGSTSLRVTNIPDAPRWEVRTVGDAPFETTLAGRDLETTVPLGRVSFEAGPR